MRGGFGGAILTSFLDLISCGLGAALLLLLIGATATPVVRPAAEDQTVLIVARTQDGPAGEIGLEWRPIYAERWHRSELEVALVLSTPSDRDRGASAVLILQTRPADVVEVRPYLREFLPGSTLEGGCRVTMEAYGQGIQLANPEEPPSPMFWPNETGQSLRIFLPRRKASY